MQVEMKIGVAKLRADEIDFKIDYNNRQGLILVEDITFINMQPTKEHQDIESKYSGT